MSKSVKNSPVMTGYSLVCTVIYRYKNKRRSRT
nr:MAG TPA: hypothetical protein [Caudoviricetes sp.]